MACAAASLLLTHTAGCQTSRLAEKRLEKRRLSTRVVFEMCSRSEARRSGQLRRDLDFIPVNMTRHGEKLEHMIGYVGYLAERDMERWQARQPEYVRRAGAILRGKPERIERSAVLMSH